MGLPDDAPEKFLTDKQPPPPPPPPPKQVVKVTDFVLPKEELECFICHREFESAWELAADLLFHTEEERFKKMVADDEAKRKSQPSTSHSYVIKPYVPMFISTSFTSPTWKKKSAAAAAAANTSKEAELVVISSDEEPSMNEESNSLRIKVSDSSKQQSCPSTSKNISDESFKLECRPSTSKGVSDDSFKLECHPSTSKGFSGDNLMMGKCASRAKKSDDIPPYKCHSCSLSFHNPLKYRSHMLAHEAPSAYFCDICKKNFASKGTLRHHLYKHIGDRIHECRFCGKMFSIKSALRKHEESHGLKNLQERKKKG